VEFWFCRRHQPFDALILLWMATHLSIVSGCEARDKIQLSYMFNSG
jgi:hypothetical protein